MKYTLKNKRQAEQTATPEKYPQGYFKDKPCKECGTLFAPKAPSHLFCSDECADTALVSRYLKRNYGITYPRYLEMLDEQGHVCKICGGEGFLMDETRHKNKLAVDHCHTTGEVRGLLCHNCNRALGLLQDSIGNLQSAIDYLEGSTTISKESTPKRVEAVGNSCIICGEDHNGLTCPRLIATC